jgi:hypothetical protein
MENSIHGQTLPYFVTLNFVMSWFPCQVFQNSL